MYFNITQYIIDKYRQQDDENSTEFDLAIFLLEAISKLTDESPERKLERMFVGYLNQIELNLMELRGFTH